MKKIKERFLSTLALCAFVYICMVNNPVLAYTPQDLYENVWQLINTKYVDQDNNSQSWARWRHKYDSNLKTEQDAYVAIETMISSLNDPYTKFLDPKEFAEEGRSIKGSLKGIGIQIGIRDGKLLVIAPIEDTPAEKAGLIANDEILEIDGKSTKGISIKDAADRIRGEEGTKVKLLVKRDKKEQEYDITRANIVLKSITTKPPKTAKLKKNIGYIRLSSFLNKNAASEMNESLVKLKNKDGYIIDLRSNPGGLLTNAIYISDMFLKKDVIVSTVDRDGYIETQKSSRRVLTDKPIVILINGGSASASEIFSGAMKDNERAVLVGEKSFGKGLVQEINRLPGGSGINITTQKYLTPNGTDINKKGIEPDIIVKNTEADIKKKKDRQLQKAHDVLQGMILQSRKS